MIGTASLVIRRGTINRSHVIAAPLPAKWPRMQHDGDGVFTPHFPASIENDGCAANDHLTFNKLESWYVCTGEFEPYSLFDASLRRNISLNTQACQSLTDSGVALGNYRLSLSGSATVVFGGTTTTYGWSDGSSVNSKRLQNGFIDVSFGVSPPTTIGIRLDNDNDTVEAISLKDTQNVEFISNSKFESASVYFYDIESWYADSEDTNLVPTNTLGWLEGFNDSQIFTVFE